MKQTNSSYQNTTQLIINVDTACRDYGLSKGRLRQLADIPGTGVFRDGRNIKIHRTVFEQYLTTVAENGGQLDYSTSEKFTAHRRM